MSETTTTARAVTRLVPAVETSDGAGVRLRRSIGKADLDTLDPFLLLDAIGSEDGADYIAGFPDHPHRGFETVTYMIEGRMRHRDSTGAEGLLESGSVQWMTAGRGIVHSEMPEQEDGVLEGFQLWVNLPAAQKMSPPRYQDIPPSDVPEVQLAGGGRLRVVAGSSNGETGPVEGVVTAPMFLDFELRPGELVEQSVTPGHTGFVYVFRGSAKVDDTNVPEHTLALLGDGEAVRLEGGEAGGRMLLLAAKPIGEPVARYGPFVMNTREEIMQAFKDFQEGRFVD